MNYFEYTMPHKSELEELFITPYRFSKELTECTYYIYSHPKHNKYNKLFVSLAKETDPNSMIKTPYLMVRYFLAHPQQFNHNISNIAPHIVSSMWKTFLGLNKRLRGAQFNQYYPASMRMLTLTKENFLEIILRDIANHNIIYHGDEMVKIREGVGLRERVIHKPILESDIAYWETLT